MEQYKPYRIVQASYEGDLNALSLSLDCQMIAVADESGEVKIFGFDDGKIMYLSSGHSSPVTSVQISPDAKIVISGDTTGSVIIWRIKH